MNAIVIEDEKPAAEKLIKAIHLVDDSIEILATISNVKDSISWLQLNPIPDLLFMDIELSDGLSFKIFEQVNINSPVIFCTAFDEYWQEALEHCGIDYLLKPIKQEKLEAALSKYDKLKKHFASGLQQIMQYSTQQGTGYKKRFLVKRGTDYVSVKTEEIAYFYATHKIICLIDNKNQKFILDHSLSDLEKLLDPAQFYRVNRKYLLNMNAIKKIKAYPKSKLQIELEPNTAEDIIISQENVASFKDWMGQ